MNRVYYLAAMAAMVPILGCTPDLTPETNTRDSALHTVVGVEDFGKDPGSFYSFDLLKTRAHATVLSLGMDIDLHFDGRMTLRPSRSSNAAPIEMWSYETAIPRVGRSELSPLNDVTQVERRDNTLRVKHAGGVDVDWKHLPEGVEQSIRIFKRPSGSGDLVVAMDTPSDFDHTVTRDGAGVEVARNGTYLFRWSQLVVTDAAGAKLPASFESTRSGFAMRVQDSKAQYPLLIDPIAGAPSWVVVGSDPNTRFGTDVSGVGDINNDGFDDVLVGQSRYANGESREGRILLYNGSATGLSATASWTYESNQASAQLGISVSGAGNVNNDAYDDLVAGAFFETNGADALAGAAYVFHGSATGPGNAPDWKQFGDMANAFFGVSVANAGDVNCDGFGDLLVGSSAYNSGRGKAWVYHGSAAGLNTTPDWTDVGNVVGADNFGSGVAGAGNINGDMANGNACDDIVVGAPGYDEPSLTNQGRIYVYHGSAAGLSATPNASWSPGENGAGLGVSVGGGGDFNGDSYDDIIIGAPGRTDTNGQTVGGFFAFHGSASGIGSAPNLSVAGTFVDSKMGAAVAVLGDTNGDGYDDVGIGAYQYSNGEANEGAAFEMMGSSTGLLGSPTVLDEPGIAGAWFGYSLASGGDFNSDGLDDAVVGSRKYPDINGNEVGAVFGYIGKRDCFVGGQFYHDGDVNPNNDCEVCNTAASTTTWSNRADSSTCDDGNLCTSNDVCLTGVCTGTPSVICNDGNPCTTNTCIPSTGLCDFDAAGAEGDTCTIPNQPSCTTNHCESGVCTPTTVTGCLIDNACYQDGATNPINTCQVCAPGTSQTAWTNQMAGVSCDDGLFCTVNDTCNGAGACNGAARDCSGATDECYTSTACSEPGSACVPTNPKPDGTACGGDLCTVAGMCTAGVCSGSTKDCSNLDTECQVGVCNLADGSCSPQDRPDGTTCDDMDACTMTTVCTAGACGGGANVDCDDGNTCTSDSCDSTTGCINTALPDNTTCDDGDACTENNVCTNGACAGTPLACDDGNECTQDSCDAALGCQFANEADGTACVGDGLSCTTGTCQTGMCNDTLNTNVCLISNTCYDDGVADPGNTCRICKSVDSTSDFSPADAGAACDLANCNADNTAVLQGSCDGLGTCTTDMGQERDCGRYFCTQGACQTQCINDAECRDGNICEAGECVDAECQNDSECSNGEVCVDQRCNPACVIDDDCMPGQACSNGVCEDVDECTTDQDCAEDEFCNNDGVCEATTQCNTDDDCDTGEICNADGVCESTGDCTTNDDCGDGQTCTDGQCVDTTQCESNADCGSDEFCSEGVCEPNQKGNLEGSGCGCAATGNLQDADASWLVLGIFGIFGLIRRRR